MFKKVAIGVDLGGTNVRVALGDSEGRILGKIVERTEKGRGAEGISKQIIEMIRAITAEKVSLKDVEGIGIGSAGPLDIKRGGLMKPTNLPFDFVPLVKPIEEEFGLPTKLLNDCVAAVMGEKYFGLGKGHDNLVYITISTGIGGGVYVDGHLLIGKDGNAHEIGHFTIDFEGRLLCGCGRRGHWEAYCSGNGIPNYARLIIEGEGLMRVEGSQLIEDIRRKGYVDITAKTIYDYAKADDVAAKIIVEKVGALNAIGFACVIDAYDPSLITVGGSVTLNNPDLVIDPIKRHVYKHARNRVPEITLTPLGEDAVLYGAIASVFLQKG
ncbi:MAG: ROK family protein [Candidatus Bathyarchaeia archaeon]